MTCPSYDDTRRVKLSSLTNRNASGAAMAVGEEARDGGGDSCIEEEREDDRPAPHPALCVRIDRGEWTRSPSPSPSPSRPRWTTGAASGEAASPLPPPPPPPPSMVSLASFLPRPFLAASAGSGDRRGDAGAAEEEGGKGDRRAGEGGRGLHSEDPVPSPSPSPSLPFPPPPPRLRDVLMRFRRIPSLLATPVTFLALPPPPPPPPPLRGGVAVLPARTGALLRSGENDDDLVV
jgi:hypothetical protein